MTNLCPLLGLPFTCKQIRQESRHIYFAVNTIHADFGGSCEDGNVSLECVRALVAAIGKHTIRHIPQLKLFQPSLKLFQPAIWLLLMKTEWGCIAKRDPAGDVWETVRELRRLLPNGVNAVFLARDEPDAADTNGEWPGEDGPHVWLDMWDVDAAVSGIDHYVRKRLQQQRPQQVDLEDYERMVSDPRDIRNIVREGMTRSDSKTVHSNVREVMNRSVEAGVHHGNVENAMNEGSVRGAVQATAARSITVQRVPCVQRPLRALAVKRL